MSIQAEKKFQKFVDNTQIAQESLDEEAIHQLRKKFKALRAIVRLMNYTTGREQNERIPAKMKKMYTAAGAVRDLQLYRNYIRQVYFEKKVRSREYILYINRKIREKGQKFIKKIDKLSFKKSSEELFSSFDMPLSNFSLDEFIDNNYSEIEDIISQHPDEEDIHTIRKKLKDIYYVKKATKKRQGNDKLHDITDELGRHNDLHGWIEIYNTLNLPEDLPTEEKKALQSLKRSWTREKNTLQKRLINTITTFT